MAITVIVGFEAKPEQAVQFKTMLTEALTDTRAYDGCHGVDVYNNVDRDGDLVLVERWESRAHYEKYLGWRTESGMMDQVGPMLTGEPSIRYFDRID